MLLLTQKLESVFLGEPGLGVGCCHGLDGRWHSPGAEGIASLFMVKYKQWAGLSPRARRLLSRYFPKLSNERGTGEGNGGEKVHFPYIIIFH